MIVEHMYSKQRLLVGDTIVNTALITECGVIRKVDPECVGTLYSPVVSQVSIITNPSVEQEISGNEKLISSILAEINIRRLRSLTTKEDSPIKDNKPKTGKPQKKVGETRNGNIVTLKQLCEQLKLEPAKARRVLRKEYPQQGKWEWDKEEIEKVTKILKKSFTKSR